MVARQRCPIPRRGAPELPHERVSNDTRRASPSKSTAATEAQTMPQEATSELERQYRAHKAVIGGCRAWLEGRRCLDEPPAVSPWPYLAAIGFIVIWGVLMLLISFI